MLPAFTCGRSACCSAMFTMVKHTKELEHTPLLIPASMSSVSCWPKLHGKSVQSGSDTLKLHFVICKFEYFHAFKGWHDLSGQTRMRFTGSIISRWHLGIRALDTVKGNLWRHHEKPRGKPFNFALALLIHPSTRPWDPCRRSLNGVLRKTH